MANYLDCILEKSCKKSSFLALIFKSPGFIGISNICQNFYTLKFNIKKNQNSNPIYYRS